MSKDSRSGRTRLASRRPSPDLPGLVVTVVAAMAIILVARVSFVDAATTKHARLPAAVRAASANGTEIPAMRNRTSDTFQLPTGAYRTVVYPGSINYQNTSGSWSPIDDSLSSSTLPGYAYQNRANRYSVFFPTDLSQNPIRVEFGSLWATFALVGAQGAPSVSGSEADYANALPGVSLHYVASGDAVKESVVFASAAAAAQPLVFSVAASPGMTVKKAAAGLGFFDTHGKQQFNFAPPLLIDAAGVESSPSDITYSVAAAQGGGFTVTVTPNPAWVNAAGRAWPVVLDPELIVNNTMGQIDRDCHIASGNNQNDNYCQSSLGYVRVGFDTTEVRHGMFYFDLSSLPGAQLTVSNADLALDCVNHSTGNAAVLGVYAITKAWDNSATWNEYSHTNGLAWATPGGDLKKSGGSPIEYASRSTDCTTPGVKHWYPTSLVQGWADGSITNDGLMLKQETDGVNNLEDFASIEDPNSANWPSLTIDYNQRLGYERQWTYVSQKLNDRMDLKVNVAAGNVLLHEQDLHIAGTGEDLSVDRFFNSRGYLQGADFGQVASWQLGLGSGVFLTPQPSGDVLLNDPTGAQLLFAQSGSGYTAPAGIDATLSGSSGNFTLKFNNLTKWNFDANNLLHTVVDRNNNTITYTYDANLHLTQISDTQGRTVTVNRSGGLVSSIVDNAGARTYGYAYDTSNRLKTYTDPLNNTTQFSYDSNNRITQVIDPRGNKILITYNTGGRVTTIIRVTNTSNNTGPTTTFAYPAMIDTNACPGANVTGETTVTDDNNHTTTYCWEGSGEVTHVVDARAITHDKSYDPQSGNATSFSDQDGTSATDQWNFSFAGTGQDLGSIQLPAAGTDQPATQTFCYDNSSGTQCPTNTNGPDHFPTSIYGFNNHSASAPSYSYTYSTGSSHAGNLLTANTSLDGTTTYTWSTPANVVNQQSQVLTKVTDPDGNVTNLTYDTQGNLIKYDPPGSDGTINLTYDAVSRIHTLQNARGVTATFVYDALDHVKTVTYSDSTTTLSFTYDQNGNLLTRNDTSGAWAFTYDKLNRKLTDNPPGTADPTITYSYDGVGNLKTVLEGSATTTYNYNEVNNPTTIQESDGALTTIDYPAKSNRRDFLRYPTGVQINYTWRANGLMKSLAAITNNGTGTTLLSKTYDYLGGGTQDGTNVQSVTDQANNKTTYTYNAIDRLKEALTKNSGGTTTEDLKYGYSNEGNITSQTNALTSVVTSFDYTGAGSPYELACQHTAATCDHANASSIWYGYDLDGNQTSRSTSGGTTSLAYNGRNQLTSNGATFAGGDQTLRTNQGTWHFTYTQLGMDTDVNGSTTRSYLRASDGTLLGYKSGTSKFYYLLDDQGSVIGVTNSSQALPQSYKYDGYGNDDGSIGAAQPWRFQSGYLDSVSPTSGLYKMGTRFFDPLQTRWTQVDPNHGELTSPMSQIPYLFVKDDPTNAVDSTGRLGVAEAYLYASIYGLECAVAAEPFILDPEVAVLACAGAVTVDIASEYLSGITSDYLTSIF